jgi:hypothetical protein
MSAALPATGRNVGVRASDGGGGPLELSFGHFGSLWTFWNEAYCLTGLLVCTCRVKKRKRGKKTKAQRKKERGGNPNVFVKGSLLPFYQKNTLPYPSVGGDVMRKRQIGRNKEKKENRAKSKGTNEETQDKKQKKTNGWLGTDRHAGHLPLRCCGC